LDSGTTTCWGAVMSQSEQRYLNATNPHGWRTRCLPWLRHCALALAACVITLPAQAGLGEHQTSIQRDHLAIRGSSVQVTQSVHYALHTVTAPTGAQLHEYVARSGTVFATTWSGRTLPNLKNILGTHYARYQQVIAVPHSNHHVLNIRDGDFVLYMRKTQQGFRVAAYVPTLIPQGITPADLH